MTNLPHPLTLAPVNPDRPDGSQLLYDAAWQVVAFLHPEWPEDADVLRLLVAGYNAQPALLAACKAVMSAYASHQIYDKFPVDQLRDAIALAEPKDSP